MITRFKAQFSILACLALLLGVAGCYSGCSATPGRVAYNTVAVPAMTLDHAMMAWGDYVAQFHPGVDAEQKVSAAYERAQAAEVTAIDAARIVADLASAGATNSVAARLEAEAQSQAAATALADLLSLLQTLGVKL